MRLVIALTWATALGSAASAQAPAPLAVRVQSADGPIGGATVTVGRQSTTTDADGRATLVVPPGDPTLVVTKDGFLDAQRTLTVPAAGLVVVELVPAPTVEEEVVVVATTRTGRRLDDQPTRVEVLGREEIEEKMLMTPGDIVMMLNEMGGLRVQATAPSLGAASVRVQGMPGRYTRVFSDGLPLFGQQVGGLGLLQIPPMDLGQVEVIKGVASAFYGAGAMGGVVNLLSRRPGAEPVREALVNQSTLGGTDAVVFLSSAAAAGWRASLLASGHRQPRNDRDHDGWADVAAYERGVVRPRVFWDGGAGRSAFVTAGVTYEDRAGGTLPGAVLRATNAAYVESLDTRRHDVGGTLQVLMRGRFVVTTRAAAVWQRHDHRFGEVRERDRHTTVFGEVAVRGATGRHTGSPAAPSNATATSPGTCRGSPTRTTSPASSRRTISSYRRGSRSRPAFERTGTAGTERLGRGFFAPTPLAEETEAGGLARLTVQGPLADERGTSTSVDLTRVAGHVTMTATLFASRIANAVGTDRDTRFVLLNRNGATTNVGLETLTTLRQGSWVATSTYTYVRPREPGATGRQDVALTPRHSAGIVGMWEAEAGRVGLEVYYTGRQRLEGNPFRATSRPYAIVGLLAERRVGRTRVFLNAENITDVRQTRVDSLLRPSRGIDGRWTVDAWAPLDGRALNGGVRVGL